MGAISFVNAVAKLAEEHNHHPDLHIEYNKVTVESWTHTTGGITEKDTHLMTAIDKLISVS